uniref:Uncharacterized protein n=1 Tax=Oncorhynchus tshawytscha TaxID=74940 RepID=A0A8C8I550_ONCTS
MSGSMSSLLPEMGAALFNIPTSSSNSDANTEEGLILPFITITSKILATVLAVAIKSHSTGRAVSLRCCR